MRKSQARVYSRQRKIKHDKSNKSKTNKHKVKSTSSQLNQN